MGVSGRHAVTFGPRMASGGRRDLVSREMLASNLMPLSHAADGADM